MIEKPRPIVVAVGDSDAHDAALRFAADEAVRDRRPLCLVHVVHPPREGMFPEQMLVSFKAAELVAGQLLRSQAERAVSLTEGAVPVRRVLRTGPVVRNLLQVAENADHLVLQHRQQARLLRVFTGSTTAGVVAHADLPVVSVPELWSGPTNQDVVVGLESLGEDDALLRHGFAEARSRGARLTVLHASYVPPLYDEAQVDRVELYHFGESVRARIEAALLPFRVEMPEVDVRVELLRMRPADALVNRSARSDLLVVGRSSTAQKTANLGGVTRALLREARCPVVVHRVVSSARSDPARADEMVDAS